jgi:hypothetical protein
MKKHTKVYLDAMKYDVTDFIPCEICEDRAVDIHHIEARGMGGSRNADVIENLMAVCRSCHEKYGDISDAKEYLIKIHKLRMDVNGIKYE